MSIRNHKCSDVASIRYVAFIYSLPVAVALPWFQPTHFLSGWYLPVILSIILTIQFVSSLLGLLLYFFFFRFSFPEQLKLKLFSALFSWLFHGSWLSFRQSWLCCHPIKWGCPRGPILSSSPHLSLRLVIRISLWLGNCLRLLGELLRLQSISTPFGAILWKSQMAFSTAPIAFPVLLLELRIGIKLLWWVFGFIYGYLSNSFDLLWLNHRRPIIRTCRPAADFHSLAG